MSVDTEAEKAIRVEKREVRAWALSNPLDHPVVGSVAEKASVQVVKPDIQPMVPAGRPEAVEAVDRVEKRAVVSEAAVNPPASLLFHWVQPYELENLRHLVRPISLAVASATTGCALGMIPLVHSALDAVRDLSKVTNDGMLWYLIYAMIFALSAGVSVIAWINTLYGRSDARRLLREIRQRPKIALAQAPQ